MKSKNFLALVVWCGVFFFSHLARGQSPLAYSEASAFYLEGGFAGSNRVNSFGGQLGYIMNGVVSFGLGVNRMEFKNPAINGLRLAPSLSFRPIRLNARIPIAVAVSAGYMMNRYPSDQLPALGLNSLSEAGYGLNTCLFSHIPLSPKMEFLPALGIQYFASSAKREYSIGRTSNLNSRAAGVAILAGFRFKLAPASFLVATPAISIFQGETVFAVNLAAGFHKAGHTSEANRANNTRFVTRLPNCRAKLPGFRKYTDEEILAAYRKKFPHLILIDDERLIQLIEAKHSAAKSR
jgi:hypothetical protein